MMRIPYPTRSAIPKIYLLPTIPLHVPSPSLIFKTISRKRILSQFSDKRRFSAPPSSTMAGEPESNYGFERPEMYKSNLAGTVDSYDRHLFLCYKSHQSWPARVEASDSDPLPKLLASALKARKSDIAVKTRLTICEGGDDVKLSDGDVLLFPEMIKYRGLKDSDVDSFVEDVLVNGNPWVSGVQEDLTGSFVFVCAHTNRDRRCGVCGPILIEKFKEEIESKDLEKKVIVSACSHIGGHKYAGNVITFSTDPEGQIAGNWYGYVTPNDVHELLDKQIVKGEVIDRIWRGHMGSPVLEPRKVEEIKLTNETNVKIIEKQPRETGTEENSEIQANCCQGANGSSCCRDENVEEKTFKKEFSCWPEKWEQHHVLTTAAVVGAVATIVAYSLYRRAR